MSMGRTLVVSFLTSLLLLSVLSANLVVGVDRTVLDREFVQESLDEEDAYAIITDEMTRELTNASGGATDRQPTSREFMTRAITEEYVRNQTENNIDRLYNYLHGDSGEVYFALNTRPVKERAEDVAREMVLEEDVEKFDEDLAEMAESEEQFEETREEFKRERLDRIQEETDEELDESELEERYDERRGEYRDELRAGLEENASREGDRRDVQEAMVELGMVRVNGLLDESLTYDEFMDDLEDAHRNLASAIGNAVRAQLDEELPNRLVLTEEMDEEGRQNFEMMQSGVSILNTLALILPLASLGLAGLVAWLAATRSSALWTIGGVTAVAGIVGDGAMTALERLISTRIESGIDAGDVPQSFGELLIGLIQQFTGAFSAQSRALAVLGVLLVAAGAALRLGLFPVGHLRAAVGGPLAGEAASAAETASAGETADSRTADDTGSVDSGEPVDDEEDR